MMMCGEMSVAEDTATRVTKDALRRHATDDGTRRTEKIDKAWRCGYFPPRVP